jgi:cyanophycin synthetase
MDENNPRIKEHCCQNGLACVFENGYVTMMKGTWKIRVLPASKENSPDFEGKQCIISTTAFRLYCLLSLYRDINIDDIRTGLQTFIPSKV